MQHPTSNTSFYTRPPSLALPFPSSPTHHPFPSCLDVQLMLIDGNALELANMNGGGVFNQGVLQIFASVVKGHKADEGGAIYNAETGTIEAVSTAFSDNDVSEGGTGQGGGIHNDGGGLFVESCSYENNKAAKGGGSSIYSEGSLTIIATTFDDADSVVGDDGELRDAAFGGSVVFVGGTINSMFGGTVYVNVSSWAELAAAIADKAVITVTEGSACPQGSSSRRTGPPSIRNYRQNHRQKNQPTKKPPTKKPTTKGPIAEEIN